MCLDGKLIHRDLKPDNIMLVPDPDFPGGERVKILDFGIAKMAESLSAQPLQTKSDVLMGTPTYMAPEQCRGAKLATDRSDVYSLGVILYQMLASYPPFHGASLGELIAMHLMEEPPPLKDAVPSLSPKVERLVLALLSKKPSDRPSMEKAHKSLLRLEEESKAEDPTPKVAEEARDSSSDSQRATIDVPSGEAPAIPVEAPATSTPAVPPVSAPPVSAPPAPAPAPAPAAAAAPTNATDVSTELPTGIFSDTRHLHIPKQTVRRLQFLAAGIATVSLIVAGAILWGFRPSADSTHAPAARSAIVDAAVISPKPEPTPDTSVRIATPDQKSESAASVKPDKGMGIHRETGTAKHAETPHVGKAKSQNATDDAVATTETPPAPQPAEPKIEKAETPLPVQSNPEKTPERTAATPPTAPAARTPDDPFDPLRTAEDYILQGSYRRAMDLATQFGRQDPMRAWEIFGRAACGLRLADRANRAFRELQQRHEDRRISSLQEYCRLHKLILSGAP